MAFKVVIKIKGEGGKTKEESVRLSAQSESDAEMQRGINEAVAERKYGKANVISVTLHEIEEGNL